MCSHLKQDLGRRDDMWSLFFVIVDLLSGTLPWKEITDKERILDLKQRLCSPQATTDSSGLPLELCRIIHHLHSLAFADVPEYSFIEAQLLTLSARAQPGEYASFGLGGAIERRRSTPIADFSSMNTPQRHSFMPLSSPQFQSPLGSTFSLPAPSGRRIDSPATP